MKDDKIWMKFNDVVDVLGRFCGNHVKIDRPAFWPPYGSLVNGFVFCERTVGHVDMNPHMVGNGIKSGETLLVLRVNGFGDGWNNCSDCHIKSYLIPDFGVYIWGPLAEECV